MKTQLSLCMLLLASCSFNYDDVLISDEDKEAIPDIMLSNLSERVYDKGDKILEFHSDSVKIFETRRIQEIEGLVFTQFDSEGAVAIQGSANFASRDIGSDDIRLSGDVSIYVTKDSSQISGDEFLFSPEQNLIWSPSEVVLVQDDGSQLRGRGFLVDLLLQELRFDSGASGVLVDIE